MGVLGSVDIRVLALDEAVMRNEYEEGK